MTLVTRGPAGATARDGRALFAPARLPTRILIVEGSTCSDTVLAWYGAAVVAATSSLGSAASSLRSTSDPSQILVEEFNVAASCPLRQAIAPRSCTVAALGSPPEPLGSPSRTGTNTRDSIVIGKLQSMRCERLARIEAASSTATASLIGRWSRKALIFPSGSKTGTCINDLADYPFAESRTSN